MTPVERFMLFFSYLVALAVVAYFIFVAEFVK